MIYSLTVTKARTPRVLSLQSRALQSIGPETVKRKRSAGNSQCVFFLGLNLGQIRPINGEWGWRTKTKDFLYSNEQEAAEAFVNWVLRRFWSQHKQKIEAVL